MPQRKFQIEPGFHPDYPKGIHLTIDLPNGASDEVIEQAIQQELNTRPKAPKNVIKSVGPFINPSTGEERPLSNTIPFISPMIDEGTRRIINSPMRMAGADETDIPGGISDIFRGGMQAATPAMLPRMIAHPLTTAKVLGPAMASQFATETAGNMAGFTPGQSALMGDVSGLFAGGLASSPKINSGFRSGFNAIDPRTIRRSGMAGTLGAATGAAIGYGVGHPYAGATIGGNIGALAGGLPAFGRGFRAGMRDVPWFDFNPTPNQDALSGEAWKKYYGSFSPEQPRQGPVGYKVPNIVDAEFVDEPPLMRGNMLPPAPQRALNTGVVLPYPPNEITGREIPRLPGPSGEFGPSYGERGPIIPPEPNIGFTLPFRRGIEQGSYQMPAAQEPLNLTENQQLPNLKIQESPSEPKPVKRITPKPEEKINPYDRKITATQVRDYVVKRTNTVAEDLQKEFGLSLSKAKEMLVKLESNGLISRNKEKGFSKPEIKKTEGTKTETKISKQVSSLTRGAKRLKYDALVKKENPTQAEVKERMRLQKELGLEDKYKKDKK